MTDVTTWDTGYPGDVTWDDLPASWSAAGLSLEEVARYAGASSGESIQREASSALALVSRHLGAAAESVPPSVVKSAVLEVASDLYARRQHHNGIVTFDGPEGVTPFRVNRDPLASVYPMLRPYIAPPVA